MPDNTTDRPPEALTGTDDAAVEQRDRGEDAAFPVVGVGASAGGLEAFTQLLKALPHDTGIAFVLVQHLAPTHASALAEILSRATRMPVREVQTDSRIQPNHVYVIPPDSSMVIAHGVLQLLPREGYGIHRPVDRFFRSLAEDRRHQAIGVILSGTATDGTIGLEAIKAEGGITFAQDATAQHDGMPQSAIASGCVDFVLPPIEIARQIVLLGQHRYAAPEAALQEMDDQPNLSEVVQLLHDATGVDFRHYKFNTVYRRITRRMVLNKMNRLSKYVEYLRLTPTEVQALFQDILISVTRFFRDTQSFDLLKGRVFPRLLLDRGPNDPVRLWTLGCSTGQEAYSLAIAFVEAAETAGSSVHFQLFATDLNPAVLEKARAGRYSKEIAQDVSPERLRRFFTEEDGSYRINKSIRDACIFSQHNVLADPPFSRIDLISCRNLLIYLERVLQDQIVPTLHYALKPGGSLWLGGSETIGGFRKLFDVQDAKHRFYTKKSGSDWERGHFPLRQGGTPRPPFAPIAARPTGAADLPREADRILLSRFSPPGVLVSADLEILQYRGDTGAYLAPAPGTASLNLLKMLREGLLVTVRAAVLRAREAGTPVREDGLRVKSDAGYREVAIEVIPVTVPEARERGFLVMFEDSSASSGAASASGQVAGDDPLRTATPAGSEPDAVNARLAQELAATREYLQSMVEQQEAANEELQAANEEIQSTNEELQSTNEELETSKEEIQSSNEELATVNDELNNRNDELNRLNNDLVNLIGSVQMAIVMLGPDLRVRRFTPSAEALLNLIPSDVGRPLADIKLNLQDLPELEPLLAEVLDTVSTRECDVRDKHGRWYSLRLRPYRTQDDRVDGVVVVLVDMTDRKQAEAAVETQNLRLHLLWEAAGVLLSTDDPDAILRGLLPKIGPPLGVDSYFSFISDEGDDSVRLASCVGIAEATTLSVEWLEFGQRLCAQAAVYRQPLVATHLQQSDEPAAQLVKSLGLRAYVCRPLVSDGRLLGTVSFASRSRDQFDTDELAVLETISHYVAVAYERRRLLNQLQDADRHKNEFLAMLAHELRNPLAPISNALEIIRSTSGQGKEIAAASEMMRRQVGHMVRLVDDLLDVSRISRGIIELRKSRVELAPAVNYAVAAARSLFEDRNHELTVRLPEHPVVLNADPTRLAQVLGNLLNNACKFTDSGGRVSLTAEQEGDFAVIRVRDSGIGLSADQRAHIFEMFMQVDVSLERSVTGLGIGLTLVKTLVDSHGGSVEVKSAGAGQGTEFIVRLPVMPEMDTPARPAPIVSAPALTTARRILVVDDNRDSAASLAIWLGRRGNETRTAHDGLEAVAAAETFRPDVVLLDIGLPKLNGYEVAKQIREQPWGKTILLVALTGWSQADAREKSRAAGFDEHIVKPVEHAALLELLAQSNAGD